MGVKGSYIDKTATESKLVSKLNSMVMLSKRIIFWYIHHSPISMWETVLQFNGNLMTQFNKGEDYEGMRAIKILEFENSRSNLKKSVAINEIKKENNVRQIIYINQGHLSTKVTTVIHFTGELVISV